MPGVKDDLGKLLGFLGSMRFGLALLLLIGITAAGAASWFQNGFSQSWLFRALSVLLILNLLLCTWKRGKAACLHRRHDGRAIVRLIALFVLHTGFLCILLGFLAGSFWGQDGLISLSKGEVAQGSEILGQDRTFSLKLDDFRIDSYPDGTPAQYTSLLTLLDHSNNTGPFDVTVNHPLVYQGVKIYQESYSWAVTAVSGVQTQMNNPATVKEGDFLSIPGAQFKIRLYRFIPDYDEASGMASRSPQPLNPRIIYSIYKGDQLLDVGLAKPGQDVTINNDAHVRFTGYLPVSTLRVKTDPGAPLVWIGGSLLLLGIFGALCQPLLTAKREDQEGEAAEA